MRATPWRRFGLVFTVPEALHAVYDKLGIDIPGAQRRRQLELPCPAPTSSAAMARLLAYANVDYRAAWRWDILAARTAFSE